MRPTLYELITSCGTHRPARVFQHRRLTGIADAEQAAIAAPSRIWSAGVPAFAVVASMLTIGTTCAIGSVPAPARPSCPPQRPQSVRHNASPSASRELAPAGARKIVLCRYARAPSRRGITLVGSDLVVKRGAVAELTHEFDELKRFPTGVVLHCPPNDGSEVLVTLRYRSGREVTIRVLVRGCNGVTNGNLVRTSANINGQNPAGPRLLTQLKRLTSHDRLGRYADLAG